MPIGVFDLFSIGVGPSSSHTVGPMRAARDFVERLATDGRLDRVAELEVDLYGSLAATGHGHGTLPAILLGLEGAEAETVDPAALRARPLEIDAEGRVNLGGRVAVAFASDRIRLHPLTLLPRHSNGLRFAVRDARGETLDEALYFSVGGGFIEREGEPAEPVGTTPVPHPFDTAADLVAIAECEGEPISRVQLRNELAVRPEAEVRAGILRIAEVMDECVAAGIAERGLLPGGLEVRRRAPEWAARLEREDPGHEPAFWQERVNLVALAVNEENASGGRIVTAPTNGAAGIIPAVLRYALDYAPGIRGATDEVRDEAIVRFLLAATAIGALYKARASISGAEVGCQGEVGSASSMAAGALAEVMGGTPRQVENAAEIAMEHNLGLTCDPVGGLVQIPCIERNAIAAAKAINAAKMALWGDGEHRVSLDTVIETMRQTGLDMSTKYKETSTGGLAVNVVEC